MPQQTPLSVHASMNVCSDTHVRSHYIVPLQDGRVLSFGRPTYGRLGRRDVGTNKDDPEPEPRPITDCKIKAEGATDFEVVDNGFADVPVAGIAAGWWHNIFIWWECILDLGTSRVPAA